LKICQYFPHSQLAAASDPLVLVSVEQQEAAVLAKRYLHLQRHILGQFLLVLHQFMLSQSVLVLLVLVTTLGAAAEVVSVGEITSL
jgi:hypothetical protein